MNTDIFFYLRKSALICVLSQIATPWNFGVSYFCSEVSTGTPMRAFELIVELEEAGMARGKVVEQLKTQLQSQIGFEALESQ